MKNSISYRPEALSDLLGIRDWYRLKTNDEIAISVIQNIVESIKKLELFPNLGALTPDPFLNENGFRMLIIKRHVAIYKLIDNTVHVYHIFDSRRDYTKIIHNEIKSNKMLISEEIAEYLK